MTRIRFTAAREVDERHAVDDADTVADDAL